MTIPGFPNTTDWNWRETSKPTAEYNCFAHALHDDRHYIWPDPQGQFSWPIDREREDSVACIQAFLESLGFERCNYPDFESGYQKVAIFADQLGYPLHLARQKSSGRWTSKMADKFDIEHDTVRVLEDGSCGSVVVIMKRKWTGAPPALPPLKPGPPTLITSLGVPLSYVGQPDDAPSA